MPMDEMQLLHLSQDGLQGILQTMELYHKAAVVASEQLMVLQQTEDGGRLFASGSFYSLEDHLSPEACREIRRCIEFGEEGQTRETLVGVEKAIRILPLGDRVLLLFEDAQERFPALLLDAARMRQSASVLLATVSQIEALPGGETAAARIRREAMRLIRQASHCELLGGENTSAGCSACDIGALVHKLGGVLREKGISIQTEAPVGLMLAGDAALIHSAVMTLISNSLRYGGEKVQIRLRAQRHDDGVLLRIEDDGPGMSAQAIARQANGWKQKDAGLLDGDWGMGIPFASRVAELHGGRLYYLYGKPGCTVCLMLRDVELGELESGAVYESDSLSAVDVELSVVLGADAYRAAGKAQG